MSASAEFLKLLEPKEDQLHRIKGRYFVLAAFSAELDRATRGKSFRILNEPFWVMALDSRDMLVVHLASWCKSVYTSGGFLAKVQATHPSLFRASRRNSAARRSKPDDQHLQTWLDNHHREAFERLFPDAHPSGASQDDVEALRDHFEKQVEHVLSDRGDNRAHPYEKKAKGSVKMLNFDELRSAFETCEGLLNDLRLLGEHSTRGYHDLNNPPSQGVAQELVDAVLLGSAKLVPRHLTRDQHYEDMHARYDARELPPDPHGRILFNDLWA